MKRIIISIIYYLIIVYSSAGVQLAQLESVGNCNNDALVQSTGVIDGPPRLILPVEESQINFGKVELGQSRSIIIRVKGYNLTSNLTVTIYRDDASMFRASVSSIDRSRANSDIGDQLTITYTPTKLGYHKTRLVISDGGITGSCGLELNAQCVDSIEQSTALSINLDCASKTVNLHDVFYLNASVLPDNAQQNLYLTSSNPNIVLEGLQGCVSAFTNGYFFYANELGEATITAKTIDGSEISATCRVFVQALISSISLNNNDTILYVGETKQLQASILPEYATNKTLEWTSSDTNVASVDDNGIVTALSQGITIISAHTNDGSDLSASCVIEVRTYVSNIYLNKSSITLCVGDSETIIATVSPENASNSTLSWISSNPDVVTVTNSGIIKGVKPGNAIITVKATDGSNVMASCEVTVLPDYALIGSTLMHVRGDKLCNSNYSIELINNKSNISALQFDMTLPTGLSLAMKNGNPDVWLDDARKTRTHSVGVNAIGTNKYRFVVSSTMNKDLIGHDGDLVHMNLIFDTIHPAGTYYINLNNIVLTESDETQHSASNTSSMVLLKYLLGDANADFSIDAADYVATAARILNKPVPVFYSDAANVNGDNNVNVTDLVGITNIALGIRPIVVQAPYSLTSETKSIVPEVCQFTTERYTFLGKAPVLRMENDRDRLYIEDFTIQKGETKRIELMLQNDTVYSAFQTDLYLPNGLEVVMDGDEFIIDLTERAAPNHTVSSFTQEDGAIRIFVTSQSLLTFSGNSGAIAEIEVSATKDVRGEVSLCNSMAIEENSVKHILEDCIAKVNGGGSSGVNGDINGDSSVDIADVNAVINMMLGKVAQTAPGDVTGDGLVDIADVNAVINIMLGKQ
ncbi:MAG: Ig-like domain-containing protein [Muribaculaceae bacterium]|nr:Ig-like domain-containing protein [Muribaculaceae bacterium]